MQARKERQGKNGYIAMEFLLVSLLATIVYAGFIQMQAGLRETNRAKLAGAQLQTVIKAADGYIQANATALLAAATPTNASIVTGPQLVAGGHLVAGWKNQNVWGQSYLLYVIQPNPGQLTGYVVTTGGEDVASKPNLQSLSPLAAEVAGAGAGFVPSGDLPGESTNVLQGITGSWDFNTSTVTNMPSPGAGHLAGVVHAEGVGSGQDYLYRVGVPGQPELNQMQVNLDMDGNAITDIASLGMESTPVASMACDSGGANDGTLYQNDDEGMYICRDGSLRSIPDSGNSFVIRGATVALANELVPKVTCPSGDGTSPVIFTAPYILGEGTDSPPIHRFYAVPTDQGTDWLIRLRLLSKNDWVDGDTDSRVMVLQMCM